MDIKQLRYFVTASECLNYAHTAAAHYTTKRSITYAIRSLEEEFHRKLFVVEGNRPRLTVEGERFAKKAKRVVNEFDRLIRDFSTVSDDYQSQMRVRVDSCLLPCQNLLDGAVVGAGIMLQAFVEESDPESCIRGLYDMRADLAFARYDRLGFEGLGIACFGRYRLGVLLGATHSLARRERLSIFDLGSCRLVVSRGHRYRYAALLSECRSKGVELRELSCVDEASLVLGLIDRRDAVALVAMEGEGLPAAYGRYRAVPLDGDRERYLYDCLAYRDDMAQVGGTRSFLRNYVMGNRLSDIGLSRVDPLIAALRGYASQVDPQ